MKSFIIAAVLAISSSSFAASLCNVYPVDASGNTGESLAAHTVQNDGQAVLLHQTATDSFMALMKPDSMMVGMVDNATNKVSAAVSNGSVVAFFSADKGFLLICARQ
jgi:hypothetical protein